MSLLWLLACGVATPDPALLSSIPRTPQRTCERLDALGVDCHRCEGGSLGDELSIACMGAMNGHPFVLDAVTTGAPLPPPDDGVGALVEDLWVEVRVEGPADAAARLMEAWQSGQRVRETP